MAKKKQKKNQTQGYLDIIKNDVSKMGKMAGKHVCKCGGKCEEKVETIVITVEGGLIQDIDNPTKHKIIVRDYDIEGYGLDELVEDENGNECVESEW
jgi:hypothetical protein